MAIIKKTVNKKAVMASKVLAAKKRKQLLRERNVELDRLWIDLLLLLLVQMQRVHLKILRGGQLH